MRSKGAPVSGSDATTRNAAASLLYRADLNTLPVCPGTKWADSGARSRAILALDAPFVAAVDVADHVLPFAVRRGRLAGRDAVAGGLVAVGAAAELRAAADR